MTYDGPKIWPTLKVWWRETLAREGILSASGQLAGRLWNYGRDSLPDRRRQRYGDIDYDWDFHVNTTGATVSWRDRLLGEFLSPYQPTEPGLFHEMMAALPIDFSEFTFIDLGSGKGRTLLMAADYPFRKVLGVELLPELNRSAQENIRNYRSESQKCFAIESVCADAREYAFPPEPIVLYLFNPLPEAGLAEVIQNLTDSPGSRPAYVIYHNPLLENALTQQEVLHRIGGTHQYAIYRDRPRAPETPTRA